MLLPPSKAKLSTLILAVLGKLLVFAFFSLCLTFLTAFLPGHCKLLWRTHDDVRPQDWGQYCLCLVEFAPKVNLYFPLSACRRFCLAWLRTTGLWTYFTKSMVLSNGLALAGCFFLLSCSRVPASSANTLSWHHLYHPSEGMCTIVLPSFKNDFCCSKSVRVRSLPVQIMVFMF